MESLLRNWNCRACGRNNNTEIRPDGTVTCQYCSAVKSVQPARNRGGETPVQLSRFTRSHGANRRDPDDRGPDPRADSERRDAFVRLRQTYVEAQKLVANDGSYTDLQWILGAHRDATQNPPALDTRTIELVALWLQDLASEVDRRLPAKGEAASNLRAATARFLRAFRSQPAIPAEISGSPRFEGAVAR